MGMRARYMKIDEPTIAPLVEMESDAIFEAVIELEEEEKFEVLDVDKMWDALHCFCTNVSASFPIEGDKLSEAIVGVHVFNEDNYITVIDNEELPPIIAAMKAFDFKNKKATFDLKLFEQEGIYPSGIWNKDKNEILNMLDLIFHELITFYEKAHQTNHHIIYSVF